MRRSFESVFVEQCAPTLAGVKPSNLFSFQSFDEDIVKKAVSGQDLELHAYGLSVCLLKQCKTGFFLIYTYRMEWINRILSEQANRDFLERSGYAISNGFTGILRQLSNRFRLERQFPHEIGLFLGYPLHDVVGFIENNGRNFTCSGYWKSYEDTLLTPSGFSADKLPGYDAVAFGCPAMGTEELDDTEFGPMFSALENSLSGKKIALFGSFGWGDGQKNKNT
ncbi:DUF3793 family protein [Caproicibacter fermentans]|uniref:DUF3793 family protein n=1 Tax=Caproicibacter fermentans TaxID=2576756 RepID=A0A7G8TAK3_9FIRM|nr:DUF3793 family protein [Caproicibacter fermentans]QNK40644.1 DUF3793 family protein [Caproicibacter fermentans]